MKNNFLLISQPIIVESPILLYPGYTLKKPDKEQLEEIFKFHQYSSNLAFMMTRPKYETINKEIDDKTTVREYLEQDQWRYAIIEYEGLNYDTCLIDSLRLSDSKLEILCDIMLTISGKANDGFGYRDFNPLATMVANLNKKEQSYTLSAAILDLKEILEIKALLEKINFETDEYASAKKAITAFKELSKVERNSYLRVLSLVSIIEHFIVHNPVDKLDSITRQIKKKFTLLNNFFHKPIKISDFFKKEFSSDKIITSIYSLRSNIAHGITFELKKDQLNYLESFDTVLSFLDTFCRRLIILSIMNPKLLKDIRDV